MSRATLELIAQMKGADKVAGDLDKMATKTDGLGSKIGAVFGGLGTAALAGTAVAGAAIVGFAAKGIADFVQFQGQMNEVFTLLPGISEEAMGKMTGDVKNFSKEFGVLPEKVVPALYQSLSAGVPPDNVFKFLEVAQKAAKGGVTDLTTAVDGITSVVNAYGEEMVDATKASDLMFTTVKLGKTNFTEMSKSLFNVIPTAASLGVKFEDVTAALATLTLQGTPTSVATTQIRSALVEASSGGTKLSAAIKELTGKSFTELIASGQDVGSIFEKLRGSMDEQKFKDLFGSVEALNAVLGITGPNADSFSKTLAEMGKSAGATDAAFKTMDSGLGSAMEKLQAAGSVLLLEIGEKLAPMLSEFAGNLITWFNNPEVQAGISTLIDFIGTGLSNAFQNISTIGKWLADNVITPLWNFFSQPEVQTNLQNIATAIGGALVGAFNALKEGAGWVFDNIIKPIWDYFQKPEVQSAVMAIASAIGTTLAEAWKLLSGAAEAAWTHVIKPIFDWFGQTEVQQKIGEIASAIGTTLAVAWTTVKDIAQGAWDNVLKPIWDYLTSDEVRPIIEGIATAIGTTLGVAWTVVSTAAQLAWDNILKPIWDFLTSSGLAETIGSIANAIGTTLKGAFDLLTTAAGEAWKIIQTVWNWLTGQAITDTQTAADGVVTALSTGLIGGLKDIQRQALVESHIVGGNINSGMAKGINDTKGVPVIAGIAMVSGLLQAIAAEAGTKSPSTITYAIGQNIGQGLANGMASMLGTVVSAARNLVAQAVAAARKAGGIESPSTEFHIMGEDIDQGLADGIWDYRHIVTTAVDATMAHVISHAADRLRNIPEDDLRAIAEGGVTAADTYTGAMGDRLKNIPEDDLQAIKDGGGLISETLTQAIIDSWGPMSEAMLSRFDATWGSAIARAQEVMAYLNSLNLYGSATGGPGYSAPTTNPAGGHRPVQAMARGGSFWTHGPTPLLVGEGRESELVTVTPRSQLSRGVGIGDTRYRGPGVVIEKIEITAGLGADGRQIARDLIEELSIRLRNLQDLQSQVSYG